MNTEITLSAVKSLSLSAASISVRFSKKDIFAQLPADMKRPDKEAAFARYAEQFSATEAAALAGALASGQVRLTRNRVGKTGRTGSIGYEVVRHSEPRLSATEKLRQENESLRAQLAAATQSNITPVLSV